MGALGVPRGAFWTVLGASWAVSGSSWAVLGPSWGQLGPSWAVLGASWGVLGESWAVLGQLGAPWGCARGLLERGWSAIRANPSVYTKNLQKNLRKINDSVRCAHGSSGLSSAQQQPADLVLLLRSVIGGVIYFEKQEYCHHNKQPRPEQGKLTSRQKVTPTAEKLSSTKKAAPRAGTSALKAKSHAHSRNNCPPHPSTHPQTVCTAAPPTHPRTVCTLSFSRPKAGKTILPAQGRESPPTHPRTICTLSFSTRRAGKNSRGLRGGRVGPGGAGEGTHRARAKRVFVPKTCVFTYSFAVGGRGPGGRGVGGR